jgi:Cyclic nucleotide-binding domain
MNTLRAIPKEAYKNLFTFLLSQIVLDRRKIAWEYLKGLFIFDLITNVPFTVSFLMHVNTHDITFHFIKIATLFRFCRLPTFVKSAQRVLMRLEIDDKYLELFKIATYWIFCIHWATCLHIIPGLIVAQFRTGIVVGAWYENDNFQRHEIYGKYVICLFKSVKTFMGTGYIKDLQPTQFFDKIYASMMSIAGRVGLCVTLAYIYQLVQGVRSSSLRYDEMMVQLNNYTACNRLSSTTKAKLRSNYDYMFRKHYFNEREILRTISATLRQQIMVHNARKLVDNSEFFENLPSHLIMRIISSLSNELFLEGDVVYCVGEIGTAVYFIASGSVAFYSSSGKEVRHYSDGDYFGEITLVSDVNYRFCKVVALETTKCYK